MNKAHLKALLNAYLEAERQRSFEHILQCSDKFSEVLKRVAPVKELLDDDMKSLVVELQNTHLRAIAIVREQRDEMKLQIEQSSQYKDRAKAYAQTQFAGQNRK